MVSVGFTLQPEEKFLGLLDGVIRSADHLELAPETTWQEPEPGVLLPNGFHRRFAAYPKPFVAHGVGLSMGSSSRRDSARQRRWLARLREDQRTFRFRWYTDHLGATALDGAAATLPLPLPMTARFAANVRRRLRAMQAVVPHVGVENNVAYFLLGPPLDEPGFLRRCTSGERMHVLLDVHNLFTMAENLGFDAHAYLERLPLEKVIEVHVSGGSYSDPAWLPGGAVRRLDGHDGEVPEEVWRLAEAVVPRCKNLRGITLERMEGTVEQRHVPLLKEELKRVKSLSALRRAPSHLVGRRGPLSASKLSERDYLRALRAEDPVKAMRSLTRIVDEDGLRLTALLIARLRFERLLNGSNEAAAAFEENPAAFTETFRRYHREVPPTAFFPKAEARAFADYVAGPTK